MATNKITKRWLLNSFGIILFILIAIVVVSAFSIRAFFYNSVRTEIASRANVISTLMDTYSSDTPSQFSLEVRGLVENFEDKDKMELMALSPDASVIITSSGFAPSNDLDMPDFEEAMQALGTGEFLGEMNGEHVMEMCIRDRVW